MKPITEIYSYNTFVLFCIENTGDLQALNIFSSLTFFF